jgi:hypothetical protein
MILRKPFIHAYFYKGVVGIGISISAGNGIGISIAFSKSISKRFIYVHDTLPFK